MRTGSALAALAALCRVPGVAAALRRILAPRDPRLAVEAFGLRFASPLGIAAGFDKDGACIEPLAALGFAFAEVGTVDGAAASGRGAAADLPASR